MPAYKAVKLKAAYIQIETAKASLYIQAKAAKACPDPGRCSYSAPFFQAEAVVAYESSIHVRR
jgi:hypothetical protein